MGLEQELADANAKAKLLQEQLEAAKAEADKFKATSQEQADKQKELEAALNETKEQFSKTIAQLEESKIKAQVAEMKTAGLITPAMEKGVFQLLSTSEKFTIEKDQKEQEVSKVDLVKHLFELAKAGEVNTDPQTVDGEIDPGKAKDLFAKIDSEIQKYQKDNNCGYADAYSVISKKYEAELQAAQ